MGQGHVLLLELVVDLLADRDSRDRRISRRQPLGHGHEVGHDAELLGREHRTRAPEAVDHFVEDEQDAVLVADLAHALPVFR